MIAKTMGHTTTRMTEKYARPDAEVTRSVVAAAMEKIRELRAAGENELLRELPAAKTQQPRLRGAAKLIPISELNGGADGARTRDLRRDRPSRISGGVWKRLERGHIAFRLLSSGSVWKRRKGGY